MQEIDVVITDFILFAESLSFAIFLFYQNYDAQKRRPYLIIFLGLGLASLCGGIYHGYYHYSESTVAFLLWWVSQLCVGMSAYGFALAGINLIFEQKIILQFHKALLFILAAYCVATFFERSFWIVIVFYLPATALTLIGFHKIFQQYPHHKIMIGMYGLVLSLIAPIIQQLKISIHPMYLTHNAVYHLILMIALLMFFVGGRAILNLPKGQERL